MSWCLKKTANNWLNTQFVVFVEAVSEMLVHLCGQFVSQLVCFILTDGVLYSYSPWTSHRAAWALASISGHMSHLHSCYTIETLLDCSANRSRSRVVMMVYFNGQIKFFCFWEQVDDRTNETSLLLVCVSELDWRSFVRKETLICNTAVESEQKPQWISVQGNDGETRFSVFVLFTSTSKNNK